ncbi:MAG: gluzincin family metallopeptidase [Planctomycetota bacterium]
MIVAFRIPLTLALASLLASLLGCASGPIGDAALTARREATSVAEDATSRDPEAAPASPVDVTHRPWRFEGDRGSLLKTPHYRIYTTVPDAKVLDRVGRFYEQALVHYRTALTSLPEPTSPLETYLFSDRHQWREKTRQMLPEQAKTFLTLGRGGLTTRGVSVLYDIGPRGTFRDTFAIAAHEGWHQYTQRVFKQHLPIWLEEGIATYMEGYRESMETLRFQPWDNPERRRTLWKAVRRDQLIPLHDLLSRSPQSFLDEGKDELLTYYAQVWALTHFLIEGEGGRYRGRLTRLLLDACHGRLQLPPQSASGTDSGGGAEAIIREYFQREPAAFRREYQRFIGQVTRHGGWRGRGAAAVN